MTNSTMSLSFNDEKRLTLLIVFVSLQRIVRKGGCGRIDASPARVRLGFGPPSFGSWCDCPVSAWECRQSHLLPSSPPRRSCAATTAAAVRQRPLVTRNDAAATLAVLSDSHPVVLCASVFALLSLPAPAAVCLSERQSEERLMVGMRGLCVRLLESAARDWVGRTPPMQPGGAALSTQSEISNRSTAASAGNRYAPSSASHRSRLSD